MNLTQLAQYRKTALALLGAVATIIVTSGVHATWATAIVTLATALGVFAVPNAPKPQVNVIDHGTAPHP